MYGSRCMFRHEHRNYKQLHRHYYTPHLYVFETLFSNSKNLITLVDEFEPYTEKLSVFREIHSLYDAENASEAQEASEGELSEIEMSQEGIKNGGIERSCRSSQNNGSFLNTTQDSVGDEIPHKFPLIRFASPAINIMEGSDVVNGGDSDFEEMDVSPESLGLDFV
jgi:hypothetical protein